MDDEHPKIFISGDYLDSQYSDMVIKVNGSRLLRWGEEGITMVGILIGVVVIKSTFMIPSWNNIDMVVVGTMLCLN